MLVRNKTFCCENGRNRTTEKGETQRREKENTVYHALSFHVLLCPVPVRSASASSEFLIWPLVHLPTNSTDRISTRPSLLSLAYCRIDFLRSGTNSAATPAFFGSGGLPLLASAAGVVVVDDVEADAVASDLIVVPVAAAPAPNAAKASAGVGGGAMDLLGVSDDEAAAASGADAGSFVSQYCVENGSIGPS
jgi:hypothetical protein